MAKETVRENRHKEIVQRHNLSKGTLMGKIHPRKCNSSWMQMTLHLGLELDKEQQL
jgi:hypothetical protein